MDKPVPWLTNPHDQSAFAYYQSLDAKMTQEQSDKLKGIFTQQPHLLEQLQLLIETSVFAREKFVKDPVLLFNVIRKLGLDKLDHTSALRNIACNNPEEFDKEIRRYRTLMMLGIIWRDFNRTCDLQQTTEDLSNFARASLNCVLEYHYQRLSEQYGVPRCRNSRKQPLIILGMGKLGAQELNLSSDIDLIFAFPENGNTDNSTGGLSNQEFSFALEKKIIESLDANTSEGFVFRVDMRLRPYGQSGALAYSFDALLEYYQTQGREWERYAMIKVSVVANNGELTYTDQIMAILRNFTFRRYVDFSAIEELRNLKRMIAQEVKRRRLGDDVKLGAGGIREVEFVAQVFQLIRGGREPELQDNKILTILPLLAERQCLPKNTAETLISAYIFLRNCEHAIQGYNDQQTQKLPTTAAEQHALIKVMGFNDWKSFKAELDRHRSMVKDVFNSVISEPENKVDDDESARWAPLWQNKVDADDAIAELEKAGHENAKSSLQLIDELRDWCSHSSMHKTSRERLDRFIPLLLARLHAFSAPSEILHRLAPLIKSVARRSAYLLLLIENPGALSQLLRLSEASPWIAEKMALQPALLDELLDPNPYSICRKKELASELSRIVLRIPEDDLESQMDTLRYFRSSHSLKVACSEITGALPLMKVSDYLTMISEVIIDFVLRFSWNALTRKHGYPDGKSSEQPAFVIVGYGKLGGNELGHGSDLDLVFIYDAHSNGVTDGSRPIENQVFYTRLGQKIIHFLTANMASGSLYDVDMRLRPSGNSGMLVSSIASFEKYQHESAWTWEHQALVRARCICGDTALSRRFDRLRHDILAKKRGLTKLSEEVKEMRHKMRSHLAQPKKNGSFNLKHDEGGIVDIEFMVQYSVLAWTHQYDNLARFTDNIRILESIATSNLLEAHEVNQLIDAYKAFRSAGHRLTLQQQPSLVEEERFASERRAVIKIWQRLMGKDKG